MFLEFNGKKKTIRVREVLDRHPNSVHSHNRGLSQPLNRVNVVLVLFAARTRPCNDYHVKHVDDNGRYNDAIDNSVCVPDDNCVRCDFAVRSSSSCCCFVVRFFGNGRKTMHAHAHICYLRICRQSHTRTYVERDPVDRRYQSCILLDVSAEHATLPVCVAR